MICLSHSFSISDRISGACLAGAYSGFYTGGGRLDSRTISQLCFSKYLGIKSSTKIKSSGGGSWGSQNCMRYQIHQGLGIIFMSKITRFFCIFVENDEFRGCEIWKMLWSLLGLYHYAIYKPTSIKKWVPKSKTSLLFIAIFWTSFSAKFFLNSPKFEK